MERYQVTGNEYLSLPTIRERDGAIEGVTFLHMGARGMLEIRGGDGLIKPTLNVGGREAALAPVWERDRYWIPRFAAEADGAALACVYLAPPGERAFGIRLEVKNTGARGIAAAFGVKGDWAMTLHEVNEKKTLDSGRRVSASGWNNAFVWEQYAVLPLFAFAPVTEDSQPFSVFAQGAVCAYNGFSYSITKSADLAPGESACLCVYFGVGYEEVAAATAAKELLRRGWDALYARTAGWLDKRVRHVANPVIKRLLNTNMFFSFFFASGRTMDTEELCLMTSRSPRYYVSAAYWDRDSLLWSFPAVLMADAERAREMLCYVFTTQIRNCGVHSRYIDGTVLEPGFELDELCAPVIALARYTEATGDLAFAAQPFVQSGLRHILTLLLKCRHPRVELYETFLQPTDDLRNFPYLTYDNMLVWRAFKELAVFLVDASLATRAQLVREAVYTHCVREKDGKRFFAWSQDLDGHYDIYDEPPGSLQLLPHYGFCAAGDEIYQYTMEIIRGAGYRYSFAGFPVAEIGCAHAPHPWVLSICNSLLSGHADTALLHLANTSMDNGIACESVDEVTEQCATGEAFATCAGFLSYALYTSCGGK
jgi:uncharacterized protein